MSRWPTVRLGEIAKIVSGGTPSRSNLAFWRGDIPWVKTAAIRNGIISADDIDEHITESGLGQSSARIVPAGTILMAMYGQGGTRGRVSVLSLDAAINQACAAVLLRDGVDRDYVFQTLRFHYERIRRMSNAGSQDNLSADILRSITIPLPPLDEQRRIADILATWDTAIEMAERLIECKHAQRAWLSRNLIDERVAAGLWSRISLDRICHAVTRKNSDGATHVLTSSARLGLVDQLEYFNKDVSGVDLGGYCLLKKGEFAYNRSTSEGYPYGAIKRLDRYEQGVLSTLYLCFAVVDQAVSSDFLVHLFHSGVMNSQLGQICQAGARSHGLLNVTKADFFSLQVPLPDRAQQDNIALILGEADREIELLVRLGTLYRRQKAGLMRVLMGTSDRNTP